MYANVVLLDPPYSSLTYIIPSYFPISFWEIGLRVCVPLGKQNRLQPAIISSICENTQIKKNITYKSIIWPIEKKPIISKDILLLAKELATHHALELGYVLENIIPQGLQNTKVNLHLFENNSTQIISLKEISTYSTEKKEILAKQLLLNHANLIPSHFDHAQNELCHLNTEPPWPIRPSAKRQIAILEYLHEHGAIDRRSLLKKLGNTYNDAIQKLIQEKLIKIFQDTDNEQNIITETDIKLLPPPENQFELNNEQTRALNDIISALKIDSSQIRLLFGITGSGKTIIYLELAKYCLKNGYSVLILAPEVALACKLHRDIKLNIPNADLYFYHGYLRPKQKENIFKELSERQKPCIVTGTRSSLFLPIPNLKTIILDEEHDSSYKQDDGLTYQSKEVAWSRIQINKGLVLLGSATPDIKTFYAAKQGLIPMATLTSRIGNKKLPPVEFVEIKKEEGILAKISEQALLETLDKNEQAIILLNRRGYAPIIFCLTCNQPLKCPNCEIGLTYHKKREKLICHYCGYTQDFPTPCPNCRNMHFLPLGEGTEKLAEQLYVLSSGKNILRIDRDSTRQQGRIEEILSDFSQHKAQILTGTQMLSKGHHFPDVTLAIILDADLGLNLPDYRATEKTFQLLLQSAGRAGRGEKQGRVIIQTRDKNHYCWKYIQDGDYEGFYEEELKRRKNRNYPPFVKLALIRISHEINNDKGPELFTFFAHKLRENAKKLNVNILGPVPAPLAILRGRKRYHCMLKADKWQTIRHVYLSSIDKKLSPILRISLDLDPVNMM